MLTRKYKELLQDPLILRLVNISLIIFFISLSDAVLSFFIPNYMEDSFNSAFLMGIVMSFSSIVGIASDLLFPQVVRGFTVKKLLMSGIVINLCFSAILLGTTLKPVIILFLLAMAAWGVYYEFLSFARQQYVADSVPAKMHLGAWGILDVFVSMAYFLGPLMANWIMDKGNGVLLFTSLTFSLISLAMIFLSKGRHERLIEVEHEKISVWREFAHWKTLFGRVWSLVVLSLTLGIVDATFWSVGTVYTDNLSKTSFWGGMFLSLYTLPALFMGFIVARWGIYKGKKKWALRFLFAGGMALLLSAITGNIFFILILVFIASLLISVAYPLTNAVYSNITERMGSQRRHLIGLSSASTSLAYIIGPVLAGYISTVVGEAGTFKVLGVFCMAVASVLYLMVPKKLKLPQKEIKKWETGI